MHLAENRAVLFCICFSIYNFKKKKKVENISLLIPIDV